MYSPVRLSTLFMLLGLSLCVGAAQAANWTWDTTASATLFNKDGSFTNDYMPGDASALAAVFFADAESTAGAGFATANSFANGNSSPLEFHSTASGSRGNATLSGLVAGLYNVRFVYVVAPEVVGGALFGSVASVGYETGLQEAKLQGAGVYNANVYLDNDLFGVGSWIGFFARSESHAAMGTAQTAANIFDIEVSLIHDPPSNVPVPAGLVLLVSGVTALLGRPSRRAGRYSLRGTVYLSRTNTPAEA